MRLAWVDERQQNMIYVSTYTSRCTAERSNQANEIAEEGDGFGNNKGQCGDA